MRVTAIIVILLSVPCGIYGQMNPQAGYVITNDNDTLDGMIDYRSGERNARECLFQKAGETEYRSYAPGEIQGYRLSDVGVYYVTQTFRVGGSEKTFFAEYLLQGGVSVYRYEEDSREYFYLVDEQGRVAELYDAGDAKVGESHREISARKHKALDAALRMVMDSEEARRELWNNTIKSKNLVRTVRRYN